MSEVCALLATIHGVLVDEGYTKLAEELAQYIAKLQTPVGAINHNEMP